MIRIFAAASVLAMGATMVVAQQDIPKERNNLMGAFAKPHYGVLSRTARGASPYSQEAVDTALAEMERLVTKLPAVFVDGSKGDVADSKYGTSPKAWENRADLDKKIADMQKAIADQKGKIKDLDTLKASYKTLNDACESCHESYRIRKG